MFFELDILLLVHFLTMEIQIHEIELVELLFHVQIEILLDFLQTVFVEELDFQKTDSGILVVEFQFLEDHFVFTLHVLYQLFGVHFEVEFGVCLLGAQFVKELDSQLKHHFENEVG
jgi:hypothetical protein